MTARMLCVDPGLRGCGVAEFVGDTLVRASYVKNPEKGRGYQVAGSLGRAVFDWSSCTGLVRTLVVIEYPRAYGSVHQKGDPNDLLDVAAVGSAVASFFYGEKIESVFPSDWKGNVPKQKMLVRIFSKLSLAERATVQNTNKSDTEDVIDAIGIGLWKLGRLTERKFANE